MSGEGENRVSQKELPGSDFRVRVAQPELIYKEIKGLAHRPTQDESLSYTWFRDSVMEREWTNIWILGRNGWNVGENSDIRTYDISTHFVEANSTLSTSDGRYYSNEEINKIQEILKDMGVEATHGVRSTSHDRTNILVIPNGPNNFVVDFGYANGEERERIRKEQSVKNGVPYVQDEVITKVGLKINLVGPKKELPAWASDMDPENWEFYPTFDTPEEFNPAINMYASTYEKFIKALYMSRGAKPGVRQIIFRPVMASDDTLQEVSNLARETPIAVPERTVNDEQVTNFGDVAGQEAAVKEARKLVMGINHPEVYEKRGSKRPKGILFTGPPGTGKTLLAKAIANESGAKFYNIAVADIASKWYGESEQMMEQIFVNANNDVAEGRKVVLFFDEIDALAPSRDNAHEATKKVIATMLQNVDGMRANPDVTVLAATNRPQDIDPALKRSGRFDKIIEFNLPDAQGRKDILLVHKGKAEKRKTGSEDLFASDIEWDEVSRSTEGMNGADLANLINLALESKIDKELQGEPWSDVTVQDLLDTAKEMGYRIEAKKRMGFAL